MFKLNRPLLWAFALLAVTLPVTAQTTGPVVTELSLERQLALPTTLTSTDLVLPDDKVQGITSGALEIRERLIYNPSGATLTSTIFVVQTGSPLPTPLNANLSGFILGVYTLNIEKIYSTTKPKNSLAFTGTVSSSSGGGVLGDVAGTPFSVSFAYTDDTPAKIIDLVHLMAGRVVVYTKDAAGTVVIPKPVTPPAPGQGPEIVISAPTVTIDLQIALDASKTTDASGTSLTFAWKSIGKSAAVLNPNTAVATVQFGEGLGDYVFEVTVTNGNGVSAKKTVTVTYLGR
ncbi:MAG: PKD domain-containing protein [Bryobacteraceae bacterium]